MRKLFLKILKKFNPGTIKIRHHYTNTKFVLDAFKHKGYWYYGKKREKETVELFSEIIPTCKFIIEIGAHIGYFSQFFSTFINKPGKVLIFEPGINNLPYLKQNISSLSNTKLEEKAISDQNGKANFYIEELTGQNNSLLSDYKVFDEVMINSGFKMEKISVEVETIRLDSYLQQNFMEEKPDFIKIDIEGAELLALQGMTNTLQQFFPSLMVEVTENVPQVTTMLKDMGYLLFSPKRKELTGFSNFSGNLFCIHKSKKDLIDKLNIIRYET
ncbi:FkbM family methyltransferase [Abyssalbus ytuae]|uniref:FkbM family methyltransferase n=1 Tax=Abyssalbus ytuae TaxID=2926907 RepID=A0A9E6ZQ91_9FLAO|nr:FkbM family methyltransferase [Abyssalbus ytuae]UOB16788.1 FkbM family methyltransferase [Abyssalbus ytuae]